MSDESVSMWAEGFKPIPFNTNDVNWGNVVYAHESKGMNIVSIVVSDSFVEVDELIWYAKSKNMRVNQVYKCIGNNIPENWSIQVNFTTGCVNEFD
tara:strand:- start:480 stop:767 length:288 start_codon:yes stop_codon:yes gene_type:complete